jgi:endonuclease-3
VGTPAHKLTPEQKIRPVLRALTKRYGPKRLEPRDPLTVLVRGVLSQNTTDVNSGRAFDSLMDRFGDWQGLAGASKAQIARAIRGGGLADQKAQTIASVMRWLAGLDGYSLEFMRRQPSEDIEKQLTAMKGVGIKTARLVLLFGFARPVFVVDTHVHRVSRRLGLIPAKCTRNRAHILLDEVVPDRQKYGGHMNLIQHGRQTCRARSPLCTRCMVERWCLYVRGALD